MGDTTRRVRRYRRLRRAAVSLACIVAFARVSTVARAHDDAWLDALDDDDAFERDEAAGSLHAMDDAGDDAGAIGTMGDVDVDAFDADAFDAFGLEEEEDDGDAVMEELRSRRLNAEDEAEADDAAEDVESAMGGGSDDVETTVVDDDVEDGDQGVVEVEDAEEVEVYEEEPTSASVDEDEPTLEETTVADDVVDAVEEDAGVVDVENERDEMEADAVKDAEPAVKSDFVGRFFSRFGVGVEEEAAATDVVVEEEETEEEEEAIPELTGNVDESESLQPVVDVEEPKVEAVVAVEEPVEASIAEEKNEESKRDESRRRLLEDQQQQQAPAPREEPQQHSSGPEIVYVGGYWKRANPWHKGPRIKAVD